MSRHGQCQDPAYSRIYNRGYAAGRRGSWHEYRPPFPPHEIVRAMFEAARKLRDAADNVIALDEPNGIMEQELGPGIDAIDAASRALTEWLTAEESGGSVTQENKHP